MNSAHSMETFGRFLGRFEDYKAAARSLASPNPDDDEAIRAAIVGFSSFAPTEQWAREHYEFVNRYRLGDFSNAELAAIHGDRAPDWALFALLCLGALLGQYQSGEIDDAGFRLGEAQLPGFMALHAGEL